MTSSKKTPDWLFRVAAKAENGGGHVSRSLILARAMTATISFSIQNESPYRSMIEHHGFSVVTDDQEQSHYDGIWMDVYADDFDRYRSKTECLAIIEDHKDLYDRADVYVRPFPGQFTNRPEKMQLAGFDYTLIDNKFFSKNQKIISETVKTITVFMGRYDSVNATLKVLEALDSLHLTAKIQIVMGGNAAHLTAVKKYLEKDFRHDSQLLIDVPDINTLFSASDLLILSGGVAILESCALGCVALVLNIADNQIVLSEYISRMDAIAYAGHISAFDQKKFADLVTQTIPYMVRRRISDKASTLIKKSGANDIAATLTKQSIKGAA